MMDDVPRTCGMAPSRNHHRLLWVLALTAVCACAASHPHRQFDSATRASAAPSTAPSGAVLTVTVTDLRNKKGDLIFGVFTHADGFPNVQAKSVHWEVR